MAHLAQNLAFKHCNLFDSPIDLVFLSSQSMGDASLELELLALFDKSAKNSISNIVNNNIEDLRIHLHSLKGAAAAVGAKAIVKIVQQTEEILVNEGHIKSGMIDDIAFEIERVRNYIAQLTSPNNV